MILAGVVTCAFCVLVLFSCLPIRSALRCPQRRTDVEIYYLPTAHVWRSTRCASGTRRTRGGGGCCMLRCDAMRCATMRSGAGEQEKKEECGKSCTTVMTDRAALMSRGAGARNARSAAAATAVGRQAGSSQLGYHRTIASARWKKGGWYNPGGSC